MPNTVSAKGSTTCFLWIFCTEKVQAEEVVLNSQNMFLLQAVNSPGQGATSTGELAIVEGTSLSPETVPPPTSLMKSLDEDQISVYVVHSGDTLPAIAKMFGVSVNTVRWANDIKGNTITSGQTLVILPISGIQHIVKSGDTLQSIAKLHKGDLDEILQYNNLNKDDKLAIGDIIVVPDGEAVTISGSTSGGVGKTGPSYPVYAGYYMRPIIGGIKTQGIHGHNGVDLASAYGSNILASAEGDVIISRATGWNGGYGSYIVLKHGNGTQTLYGHLSATLVNVGDHVQQGQVIGKMGHSGSVKGITGTHLHFEIRGAKNPF
ncbi:MAG: peptidoglycan DD-metalloendopeptidase family protein [Minisyncoccia bacterium]